MDNRLNFLEDVLVAAKKAGADDADVVWSEQSNTVVKCRNGKLEQTGSSAESGLTLRLFIGNKSASLSSSNTSGAALDSLIERTVAIAKHAPEDPYAGLVSKTELAVGADLGLDLEVRDDKDVAATALLREALDLEEAVLAVDGVAESTGASTSTGRSSVAICTTAGFSGISKRSSFSRFCGALAADNNGKENAADHSMCTHYDDLESIAALGTRVGERAVRKLGATKMATGQYPVVFPPETANALLGEFSAAIAGPTIATGMSFLKDLRGKSVFANGIQIVDDPHRRRGLGSRRYDGEGVAARKTTLVENGVLTGWMHNRASARQLGEELTGHGQPLGMGVSPSNLYLEAGTLSSDELLAEIETGLYVTDTLGQGANLVTGDYSVGAAGFLIEKGKIASPIKEITIAGNLIQMFLNVTPAEDLIFKYGMNAPTLRIDGMTVAGE